jgi:hypothetical protein
MYKLTVTVPDSSWLSCRSKPRWLDTAHANPRCVPTPQAVRHNPHRPRNLLDTSLAPSRSWMLAAWTTTASSSPRVSTTIWRLRPVTFLSASPPRDPLFCRLHRMAIYDSSAGCRLPTFGFPDLGAQGLVDTFPGTVLTPLPEVPPNGAPRR